MKIFIKAACTAFILAVLYSVVPFQAECSDISDEVFRLHILANSDSDADQSLKLRVRDKVLEYAEGLFESADAKESAEKLAIEHLSDIERLAYQTVSDSGYDYSVRAELVNMYFTTRYYDDYTLPSGMYDALRITIGEGEGHNWWCVMYPSLCISSEEERDERAKETFGESRYDIVKNEKFSYRFKIVEIFEKCLSIFSLSD